MSDDARAAGGALELPRPEEISTRERDDAMGAYLMMFASLAMGLPLPLLNIVASTIYYFINRKNSRFVAFHALQALISHIPVTLVNAGAVVWLIVELVGRHSLTAPFIAFGAFAIALNLAFLVYTLIALVRARRGQFFYLPLFGRLAFDRHFGERAERPRSEPRNEPPRGFWG